MAGFIQVTFYLLLLLLCKTIQGTEFEIGAREEKEEELVESESKDGKLEIIKRIKKINDDGSYTIGYEADDGSFKIESRDVLGHIKGTYGFLDQEGQIKRVSYSSNNSSEIITKPESSSVVQRIPSKNKTTSTKLPATTQSSPSSTSNTVVQNITRRRTTTTSTTTQKPNYNNVVNVSSRMTTSSPSQVAYTPVSPRIILQGRPVVSPTPITQTHTIRSEGQLVRPEVVTVKPTELPQYNRLAFKHLEDDKPVNEEPESEIMGNILRRQLPQEDTREYNLQEHFYSLQQSLGKDATDVYSASVTTGTPRPLFTTTSRPKTLLIPSTTAPPESVPKPTVLYRLNYPHNPQNLERRSPEHTQETKIIQPSSLRSTSPPLPVVQIPANRVENQEPLAAIRHPFQRGTILVPLSQIQRQIVPVENMREVNEIQNQYDPDQEQYFKETTQSNSVEIEQQKAIVRRLPPPPLRPIPVQVDENGFVREIPHEVPTSYPIPIPITPVPKYVNDDIDNDIDNIQPPVSTRDFQKLLEQLIARQSRLEKISALTKMVDLYQQQQQQPRQRYRNIYPYPQSYFMQKELIGRPNGRMQFIQQFPEQTTAPQRYHPMQFYEVTAEQRQQQVAIMPQSQNIYQERYDVQSHKPNRRVARLLPSRAQRQQETQDEYLPPDVREMLLLRMLQLAINPALKLDDDNFEIPIESPNFKRMPVRNVEILGEEEESEQLKRRPERTKRYRELERDYE